MKIASIRTDYSGEKRIDASRDLNTLLKSQRRTLNQMQTGISKYLAIDTLTTVKDLVIVGDGPAAEEICRYCDDQTVRGYRFRGVFTDESAVGELYDRRLGGMADIKKYVSNNRIDIMYCALPGTRRTEITDLMEFCESNTIRFRVIPSADSFIPVVQASDLEFHGEVPVSKIRKEPLENKWNRVKKRVFDMAFSLGVVVFIFTWLFPILALLVKLSSKGPVFYKQRRLGRDNKDFVCWKFRSMRTDNDTVFRQATKNDPRITKIGAIMRKTNLDEMPQFLNVLMGQMSVVGPRPHPLKLNDQYKDIVDKYMVRHFCLPGITGWAQVNGFRGETQTPDIMEQRIKLDVHYIENWSFGLDIRIVIKTVMNMFGKEEKAY